ncbi:hypothetical protein [Streptomyces meridianus]|uniref:Peptidoglycan binding domain-containing protein n=1 Tax=Streptomyces meridianus TaxID=2938945 RepID=A0ABT0X3G7_9ACTN|nr:hypothetical protein [Streptomyces meridianus]MCM2576212.1 hypothetical protein [Streptomyces meridianus]
MSRETDSSSSGPEGRGGGAYPSGTPPYGPPQYPTQDAASYDASGTSDASAPESGNPRTETQLTTRIRINIPGSRPIPPVVVRKPVEEDADAPRRDDSTTAERPAPAVPPQRPESAAAPQGPTEGPGRTSSWFAPRKAPPPPPSESAPAPEVPAGPPGPATGGRSGLPYFSGAAGGPSPSGDRTAGRPDDRSAAGFGAEDDEPSGPTTGPASGDTPGMMPGESLLPPAFQRGFNSRGPAAEEPRQELPKEPQPPGPRPAAAEAAESPAPPRAGRPQGPGERRPGPPADRRAPAYGTGVQVGAPGIGDLTGPSADADEGLEAPGPHVSGDTLVSGVPVVPQDGRRSGASGQSRRSGSGRSGTGPKGRSKAVLAGGVIVGVLGIAYGTGLLLDHADVPNGTTVLGTDIGGMSEAAAAQKLANAVGERTSAPLTLSVNGEQVQLQPEKSGLGLSPEATVRRAAGRDYNPVTVIGSLFGASHEADPVFRVDEEKLAAALKLASGEASGALDGTIRFVPGRAVPVPGKPHEALDVAKAVPAVSDAFRKQAATGRAGAVELPSSVRKPAVSNAEIQRKMRTFAQPAMSGLVTIKAGTGVIQFGPDKSLPKILSMRVVDGKLVEHYNLKAIKQLYGSTFDGVLIRRGNGSKTPVTPQDVVNAMAPALLKTDPAQRIGVIPLDGG